MFQTTITDLESQIYLKHGILEFEILVRDKDKSTRKFSADTIIKVLCNRCITNSSITIQSLLDKKFDCPRCHGEPIKQEDLLSTYNGPDVWKSDPKINDSQNEPEEHNDYNPADSYEDSSLESHNKLVLPKSLDKSPAQTEEPLVPSLSEQTEIENLVRDVENYDINGSLQEELKKIQKQKKPEKKPSNSTEEKEERTDPQKAQITTANELKSVLEKNQETELPKIKMTVPEFEARLKKKYLEFMPPDDIFIPYNILTFRYNNYDVECKACGISITMTEDNFDLLFKTKFRIPAKNNRELSLDLDHHYCPTCLDEIAKTLTIEEEDESKWFSYHNEKMGKRLWRGFSTNIHIAEKQMNVSFDGLTEEDFVQSVRSIYDHVEINCDNKCIGIRPLDVIENSYYSGTHSSSDCFYELKVLSDDDVQKLINRAKELNPNSESDEITEEEVDRALNNDRASVTIESHDHDMESIRVQQNVFSDTANSRSTYETIDRGENLRRNHDIFDRDHNFNPFIDNFTNKNRFERSDFFKLLQEVIKYVGYWGVKICAHSVQSTEQADVVYQIIINESTFEIPFIDFSNGLRIICKDISNVNQCTLQPWHENRVPFSFQLPPKVNRRTINLFSDSVRIQSNGTMLSLAKYILTTYDDQIGRVLYPKEKIVALVNDNYNFFYTNTTDQVDRFEEENSPNASPKGRTGVIGLIAQDNGTHRRKFNFNRLIMSNSSDRYNEFNMHLIASLTYYQIQQKDTNKFEYHITNFTEIGCAMVSDSFKYSVMSLIHQHVQLYGYESIKNLIIYYYFDIASIPSPTVFKYLCGDAKKKKPFIKIRHPRFFGLSEINHSYIKSADMRNPNILNDNKRHDYRKMMSVNALSREFGKQMTDMEINIQKLYTAEAKRMFINNLGFVKCYKFPEQIYMLSPIAMYQTIGNSDFMKLQSMSLSIFDNFSNQFTSNFHKVNSDPIANLVRMNLLNES